MHSRKVRMIKEEKQHGETQVQESQQLLTLPDQTLEHLITVPCTEPCGRC